MSHLVSSEYRALKGHRAPLEHRVLLEAKDHKEILERRAHKVLLVLKVMLERKAQLALKALLAPRV